LKYSLHSLLVNLPLLANLKEKFIYRDFLGVKNNILEKDNLVTETTGNVFALF